MADSQTFTRTLQKINLNDPQKILVSSSSINNLTDVGGSSKLCQLIRHQFAQIPIIILQRKYFNDDKGKQCITDYGLQEDTAGLLVGLSTK